MIVYKMSTPLINAVIKNSFDEVRSIVNKGGNLEEQWIN